jgi:valyl-tRNA synthetase
VGGIEIFVPGQIDPAKERTRLEGQRAKLANAGFISLAPSCVVEKERQNLAELQSQVESLEANPKTLG